MRNYIFAGRFGDIIHILPAVKEYAERTGTKPRFTSSHEFGPVLEGCSYLEPVIGPPGIPWTRIVDLQRWVANKYPQDEFFTCACYGLNYGYKRQANSYLRESWRMSGCPVPPERLPLVFDKRDREREEALFRRVIGDFSGKYALVATKGTSSPFSASNQLISDIQQARADIRLIDISSVKADRVFDLLGIFERAEFLVTIDTMHLHLSAATPHLPVYALICDGPIRWNRTDWRPQQVFRCTYAEFPNKRVEFKRALRGEFSTPRLFHVWNCSPNADANTLRRMSVAESSWQEEYAWAGIWNPVQFTEEHMHRNASSVLRDPHAVPFVKDMVAHAISCGAKDTDIIILSNADIGFIPGITGWILDACRDKGCTFAHRWDFPRIDSPVMSEWDVMNKGTWYPGSDLFAFTVQWWAKHGSEFPDMILGREYWDAVLRQIMKKYGTIELNCAIWHEKHPSFWENKAHRGTLPGNTHNRKLAEMWFALNRSDDKDPYRATWNIPLGQVIAGHHRSPHFRLRH